MCLMTRERERERPLRENSLNWTQEEKSLAGPALAGFNDASFMAKECVCVCVLFLVVAVWAILVISGPLDPVSREESERERERERERGFSTSRAYCGASRQSLFAGR